MNSSGSVAISNGQLVLASLLILVNVLLSVVLQLGLARSLILASARTIVQLLLVGHLLQWLFRQDNALLILGVSLVMAAIAGVTSVQRSRRRFPGIYWNSVLSVLASSALITGLALTGIIRPAPWYDAQYLIPLQGMVLGNTLNGVSLGLDRLTENLQSEREQIEVWLAHGATRWEACGHAIQDAMRVAMIPTINAMVVVGLVSLPGLMTGQILQGADPSNAVRYQIVIMFMIAAATALAASGVVGCGFLALTSPDHQLRLDRLR